MNKLDFEAVNQAIDGRTRVPEWAPGGKWRGDEYMPPNPRRDDRTPGSFVINTRKGVWKDYATGDAGSDLVSLYAYLFHDNDQGVAAKELAESHGVRLGDPATRERAASNVTKIEDAKPVPVFPVPIGAGDPSFKHPGYGQPSAVWTYKDKDGRTLLHICRYDPEGERKQVIPRSWCKHPDGSEKWAWRGITGSGRRPLYALDRLAANPEADAIVVEGEKAAEAGQGLFGEAAVVTTWLGGVETSDRVNLTPLAGRRVVLWPDFDAQRVKLSDEERAAGVDPASKPLVAFHEQPGVRAMMNLATKLKGVAREVIMVGYTPLEYPGGWDLADDGWTTASATQYMATRAGDPWHLATARTPAPAPTPTPAPTQAPAAPDAPAAAAPAAPAPPPAPTAAPKAANDNEPAVPMDAAVNPFGFPHMGEKGAPMNTAENLEYMLDQYGIRARYNEVRKSTEVDMPGRTYSTDNRANCSLSEIISMAARNRMPQGMLADYIKLLADRNAYNPVKDWITSKPWDGTKRIQTLCDTVTVSSDKGLADKLIFRWLISAVAAVFMPHGFESHGVLVFTGPQGEGKTRWVKRLVRDLPDVVLAGAVLDPANKDTVTNAISHWIVELGELDATFRKADIARLKSFVTNAVDKVRRPYDRIESEYQRRTVFFASVNEDKYLVDDTGNRRWWTIPVVAVNYAHDVDVQQVWAEVLTLWQAGEQHWLTDEEFKALNKLNAEHESVDPVEEMIVAAFEWGQLAGMGTREMTASEVLLAIGFDKPNKAQATHCSKVLKKLTGNEPRKAEKGRYFKMPPQVKAKARLGGQQFINGGAFTHEDEDRPF